MTTRRRGPHATDRAPVRPVAPPGYGYDDAEQLQSLRKAMLRARVNRVLRETGVVDLLAAAYVRSLFNERRAEIIASLAVRVALREHATRPAVALPPPAALAPNVRGGVSRWPGTQYR